jgi:cell wall-associated NlpC family hydrolase
VKLRLLSVAGIAAVLCGGLSTRADSQVVEARIGHFFDSGGWSAYGIGLTRPLTGVLGLQVHGDVLRPVGGGAGGFAGLGTDLTAFRNGHEGPYLLLGLSGGLGSETSNDFSDPWGSWSAGAGYDVYPSSFLSVGAEGRWRELSPGGRNGFEVALGLAIHFGGGSPASRPRPQLPPPHSSVPESESSSPSPPPGAESRPKPTTLTDSIIATASEAMGRPYEFGGTGAGGEGFDCSGLIQFAYGKHGIVLPRRSADQAREGKKVNRDLGRLRPADLLTFSNRGGPVTHVGLYIGGGRFIHSATRGVQVSTLSATDLYGRWWYQRWVGVRRIIP